MEKRLEIPFGNYKIVAEIDDYNMPDIPPELVVYIADNEQRIVQSICVVSEHYEYNHNTQALEKNPKFVDCLVWGNGNEEDYTEKIMIDVRKEEE